MQVSLSQALVYEHAVIASNWVIVYALFVQISCPGRKAPVPLLPAMGVGALLLSLPTLEHPSLQCN